MPIDEQPKPDRPEWTEESARRTARLVKAANRKEFDEEFDRIFPEDEEPNEEVCI